MGACLCKGHKGQCQSPPVCVSKSVRLFDGSINPQEVLTAANKRREAEMFKKVASRFQRIAVYELSAADMEGKAMGIHE